MRDFLELNAAELVALLEAWGQPAYRAAQIRAWGLPAACKRLRGDDGFAACIARAPGRRTECGHADVWRQSQRSRDGTLKRLYRLADGQLIEAVLIALCGATAHGLHLDAGGLRAGLCVLRDRADGPLRGNPARRRWWSRRCCWRRS